MKANNFLLLLIFGLTPLMWGQGSAASQAPSTDGQSPPSSPSQDVTLPGISLSRMKICKDDKTPQPCITPPYAVFAPEPEFSEEARNGHYEGKCMLGLVVGTDGKVHDLRVLRPLGHGLDEMATKAVSEWSFRPATREGKPVAVQIAVEVDFHLYHVLVLPRLAQVTVGAQQQFSASIPGAANSAMKWSIEGSDCGPSGCGTISTDGLYTAPSSVPSVSTVIVRATSSTDPQKMGSATVKIQPSMSH